MVARLYSHLLRNLTMNTAFILKIVTLWYWSLKTQRRSGKGQVLCHPYKLKTCLVMKRLQKKKHKIIKMMMTKTIMKLKPRQTVSTRKKCRRMTTHNLSNISIIFTKSKGFPINLTTSPNQEVNLNPFIPISTTELNPIKVLKESIADSNQTRMNTSKTKKRSNQ